MSCPCSTVQPTQPTFWFTEEYFTLSLNALDRKLGSVKDSLVRSSVWKEDFTKALNTYPDFELTDLEFAVPQCDACHLGGRKSTFVGRVSGRPYSKVSFEVCRSVSPHRA